MSDEPTTTTAPAAKKKFLGSLREALAAAGTDDLNSEKKRKLEAKAQDRAATKTSLAPVVAAGPPAAIADKSSEVAEFNKRDVQTSLSPPAATPLQPMAQKASSARTASATSVRQSAAEAARHARGGIRARKEEHHIEMDEPTTRFNREKRAAADKDQKNRQVNTTERTRLVRGKAKVSRADFHQDPVVGWLVVVGGPGLGAFRPIFEGNNTLGRSSSQRIPVDFGDDTISSEEQAYLRYDSVDRTFLFVPNLAKTNVVQVNDLKPTGAVELSAMDVITVGRTQLVFVPFCGRDFDWSELSNLKE